MQRNILLAFWLLATPVLLAAQEPYSLVLRNGKVVDGAGNPWFQADVAIRGDRIAKIGLIPAGAGKRDIDVRGKIVAPGFIDIHSHSDLDIFDDPTAPSKLLQGVTTEVYGEGNSPGPRLNNLLPAQIDREGKSYRWATLGEYFHAVEQRGVSQNVASYVGLSNVWTCVMGKSHARPTKEQFEQMKSLIDDAMKQGACGLSCLLAMPPGSLATTDDLVELCKVVAKHGGIFVAHIRHEGVDVLEAIQEVLDIGRRAGVQVEILHLKIADQKLWGQMSKVIERIEAARAQGVNVLANVYPYTRGHNNLSSILPPWVHEGGAKAMLERLSKPADRERIKKEIRGGVPGWYNHFTAVGGDWSRMLLTGNTSYGGLTMDRVLKNRMPQAVDSLDDFLDFLKEEGGSAPTIFEHHSEKDMRLALQQPWTGIGSDGSALAVEGPLKKGHPHPRSFGTFPRVLGVYVRELKALTLEDAVRKMTSLNAQKLKLSDRGSLREGHAADVVVFDAHTIRDRATYTEPFQYAEGIEWVFVNGEAVVEKGKITAARPGKALRLR